MDLTAEQKEVMDGLSKEALHVLKEMPEELAIANIDGILLMRKIEAVLSDALADTGLPAHLIFSSGIAGALEFLTDKCECPTIIEGARYCAKVAEGMASHARDEHSL